MSAHAWKLKPASGGKQPPIAAVTVCARCGCSESAVKHFSWPCDAERKQEWVT